MEDNFRRVPPPPPPRPNIPRATNENAAQNPTGSIKESTFVRPEAFQPVERTAPVMQEAVSDKQTQAKSSKEKLKLSLLIVGSVVAFIGALVCGYFLFF